MTSASPRIDNTASSPQRTRASSTKVRTAKAFGAQLGLAMGVSALKLPDAPASKVAPSPVPPAQGSPVKAQQTSTRRAQPTRQRSTPGKPAPDQSAGAPEAAADAGDQTADGSPIDPERPRALPAGEAETNTSGSEVNTVKAEPPAVAPASIEHPVAGVPVDSAQAAGAAAISQGPSPVAPALRNDIPTQSGEARDPLGLIAGPKVVRPAEGPQSTPVKDPEAAQRPVAQAPLPEASVEGVRVMAHGAERQHEPVEPPVAVAATVNGVANTPVSVNATAGVLSQAAGVAAVQMATEPIPVPASTKAGREASVDGVLGLRDLGRGFGTFTPRAVARAPLGVETTGETPEAGGSMEAQLARGLMAAMRHKGGVLTLRLSPEHLGDVKVELVVEGGKVSATFDAHNEQTRQLLHANLDSLKRAVEERGLVIDRVQVVGGPQSSSKPDESGPGREHANQQDPGGQSGGHRDQPGRRDRSPTAFMEREGDPGESSDGIWARELDPAQGLLRLRLDAVV